jgi:ElaB/YqjD/DUF883 family membrane-anchored ribosome-binding protein
MPETPTPSTDLNRAVRDAKKQAGEVSDAAQDLYNQAVDSASHTAGETVLRNTIEKQPYTAVAIALALGWLFGRMHRPL